MIYFNLESPPRILLFTAAIILLASHCYHCGDGSVASPSIVQEMRRKHKSGEKHRILRSSHPTHASTKCKEGAGENAEMGISSSFVAVQGYGGQGGVPWQQGGRGAEANPWEAGGSAAQQPHGGAYGQPQPGGAPWQNHHAQQGEPDPRA